MERSTILTVCLRADQAALLLEVLENGRAPHPVEADLIAKEIRLAVWRHEHEDDERKREDE
jgi:hypothetical protein